MKLGMQVALSPGHIGLHGDPSLSPQRDTASPIFGTYLLQPNGWMDQDGTWYRGEGTGTFRAQDLSFPRTNSTYGELSFPRLFVPGNFRSRERKSPGTLVPRPFRSRELSFPGNQSSWELSFPGPFVPRKFRSQDFSFPGTFVPPDYFTRHWL